jgi:SAM-dependent methyltransferase
MKNKKESGNKHFWDIRSANYDKLFWVKDKGYLDLILECAELDKKHLVLDVGTGTGTVAMAIEPHVNHVVAIDISNSMLEKGNWPGFSVIKWDIGNALFAQGLFDRVVARMVFHHILDDLDRAIIRCYDSLKDDGKIVVAEGIPPSEDQDIIDWYTEMFKLKEKRRTFSISTLEHFLAKNGFKDIQTKVHIMENFSVDNWLINSGLPKKQREKIYKMHVEANQKIKDAYRMRFINGECIIQTMNLVVTGQKKSAE